MEGVLVKFALFCLSKEGHFDHITVLWSGGNESSIYLRTHLILNKERLGSPVYLLILNNYPTRALFV